MKFEWDTKKSRSNQAKHGVLFDEAIRVFDDPFALVAPDAKHSLHEERNWLIGETEKGQVLVVVYTVRGGSIRLISARHASRKERRIYETSKGISF